VVRQEWNADGSEVGRLVLVLLDHSSRESNTEKEGETEEKKKTIFSRKVIY